jgi:hypothetical protein
MKRRRFLLVLGLPFLLLVAPLAAGTLEAVTSPKAATFPLVTPEQVASLQVDSADFEVVRRSVELLADDLERVTGRRPPLTAAAGPRVLIGTLGHSPAIDALAASGKLDFTPIGGQWEHFMIARLPGESPTLVIAGADRRGTAYGVMALCEAIGVSPWYWWADVVPVKMPVIHLKAEWPIVDGPKVAYRGIFINDEDYGGLRNWASRTFDPETKNLGPKTYEKIFELMLRLRANYLWPAMHPGTAPFNQYPENARLADAYGIVMGSSHCEQMLRNNVGEWDKKSMGDFNFATNHDRMVSYWEERVKANRDYENVYTLGLRGVHDDAMEGARTLAEKLDFTQRAIAEQRELLKRHVNSDPAKVPQILCAYKEVLLIYRNGLKLPDDVTLIWADDNHGYLRTVGTPAENQRPGGAGLYYHLSYYGNPADFLWLSTISPELLSYELTKAYDNGVRRMWVFNVGDIKPAEKELSFAMELAWNPARWTPEKAPEFIREWAGHTFGESNASEIAVILKGFYRLTAAAKPEHTRLVRFTDQEVTDRIATYRDISARAEALAARLPAPLQAAFDQLVLYPVQGARWMDERVLLARRSLQRSTTAGGDALADADAAREGQRQLDVITERYQSLNGAKWKGMMNWHPQSDPAGLPPVADAQTLAAASATPKARSLGLAEATLVAPMQVLEGTLRSGITRPSEPPASGSATWHWAAECSGRSTLWALASVPSMNKTFSRNHESYWAAAVNGAAFAGSPEPLASSYNHGSPGSPSVWYRLGEINLRAGENALSLANRVPGVKVLAVHVGAYPPPEPASLLVVAANSGTLRPGSKERLATWPLPGGRDHGIGLASLTANSIATSAITTAPSANYIVDVPPGARRLVLRALPTQRLNADHGLRLAVIVNDAPPIWLDFQSEEFSTEWQENVLRGFAARTIELPAALPRSLRLRICFIDPGLVLESLYF